MASQMFDYVCENLTLLTIGTDNTSLISLTEAKFDRSDRRLKGLDKHLIDLILGEIMDKSVVKTSWDDISGLEFAKKTIKEVAIWPLLRPDLFTGLRKSAKGILLFGPPGTGKTLIGIRMRFLLKREGASISASSLLSKWLGESERLVRTLFSVARCSQPAVIFIDEIDSLLGQRSGDDSESTRRIKTEFLVQLDGANTKEDDRVLVVAATNRPQDLDEAARRRFVKRMYIPLPEFGARRQLVEHLMKNEKKKLTKKDIDEISQLTEGYSGADMKHLCQEAAMQPIRTLNIERVKTMKKTDIRPICLEDFKISMRVIRSSVSSADLDHYLEWDKIFGASGA